MFHRLDTTGAQPADQLTLATAARDALNQYIALLQNGCSAGSPLVAAAEFRVAKATAAFAAADTFAEWQEWTAEAAALDPNCGTEIAEAAIAARETERHAAAYRAAVL